MPIVDGSNSAASAITSIRERLSTLSATVSNLQRQHYQRQFDHCWARYGNEDPSNFGGGGGRSQQQQRNLKRDRRGNNTNNNTTAPPLKRSAAVIHDLHLVGVCADHDSDASSCDEALERETARTRQIIARLRIDETTEANANKAQAHSVTAVGNAMNVTSSQMNYAAKVVAKQSVELSERFEQRRRDVEERSARRVQSIADRKAAKRAMEHGLHKALHTAPLFQPKPSAAAVIGIGASGSANGAVDANNFKLADLSSIRAATRLAGAGSPIESSLHLAVDRYNSRVAQLRRLKAQPAFQSLNAAEKVAQELAAIMKKRKEFHRVRGAGGGAGGSTNYDGEDEYADE